MPEGDTLHRAAAALHEYLAGREITAVAARDVDLQRTAEQVVGRTVDRVEARAKHLLIHLEGDLVVHSHMKMNGSWRLLPPRPLRPRLGEVLAIAAGERMALCRNAPIVRVLDARQLDRVPGLSTLGPDVLRGADPDGVAARIAAAAPAATMGDALLDQRLVSGLGNIWRCEALYAAGVNPRTPVAAVDQRTIAAAVRAGARLMGAAADRRATRPPPQVYGRTGRPCRRCGTPIVSARMGRDARRAYWCPKCQPETLKSALRASDEVFDDAAVPHSAHRGQPPGSGAGDGGARSGRAGH